MLTGILSRSHAGTRGVAAVALAAGLLLSPGLTSSARAADSAPCTPDPDYEGLYRCPIWGTDVNLRSRPDPEAPVVATSPADGWLLTECQVRGGRATYGGYWHTWWVKTPASGMAPAAYMSEIFLVGGGDDERDSGLPVC
ncbi:hypothetical protein SAMN06272735_2835 [Streptomyces sp. TLI_55]|uniref:hypothetical protein n=1 Tax=Streptomyces sp. TLI_55 TaxID=1938861 RepID=UPI000BD4482A|nr:hypothetical protein [Streptomyces sp. TLI_55]SNX58345.1 hypothetical protein SAMN06272735_2835 [Streptomyces sp. TLI_55]